MRVIAGTAKGVRLKAPTGHAIRPTLDRVREALFSILGEEVENALFLDLFAGTGANGIEALSRGADHCDFVDTASLDVVSENLRKARLDSRAGMYPYEIPRDLRRLGSAGGYDIVFADPPRNFPLVPELLASIAAHALLKPGGVFILEHDAKSCPESPSPELEKFRESRYGKTMLTFFRRRM